MEGDEGIDPNEFNADQTGTHQNALSFSHGESKWINPAGKKWLEDFLSKTFFDACSTHHLHKNELNKYCVDCKLSICQYCASSENHQQHRILKMYRHCYKDVVSLDSIKKHIDCSKIQPYKCNRRMIISLKPLPHFGSAKKNEVSTCHTCNRRLIKPNLYCYCSISCKSVNHGKNVGAVERPKQRNKRKEAPCRAPLF